MTLQEAYNIVREDALHQDNRVDKGMLNRAISLLGKYIDIEGVEEDGRRKEN